MFKADTIHFNQNIWLFNTSHCASAVVSTQYIFVTIRLSKAEANNTLSPLVGLAVGLQFNLNLFPAEP